jgi:hypothetical protein
LKSTDAKVPPNMPDAGLRTGHGCGEAAASSIS